MNSSKPDVRFLITVAHYDRYAREIIFFVPKVRPSEWSLRVFLPLIVKAMKVSLKLSHQRLSSHSPTWLYSFIHLHKLFENSNRWYVLNSTYILKNSFLNIQVLQFRWNCKIMALYLHSSRDRAQNANFLQRPRNLTHFVPPKSRPPPFSFR